MPAAHGLICRTPPEWFAIALAVAALGCLLGVWAARTLRRDRHRHAWQPVACTVEKTYESWGSCRSEFPRYVKTHVLKRCACGEATTDVLEGAWTWEQVSAPPLAGLDAP